eukprot:TRINITY_DN3899_c0_g2_i1.p2 TRINITY_DN3899_c0_g2~~TRINITY_DN3899_c0_g2_i1.p2  ORF type:complete len:364 (-),score=27.78 TRINITY_DN3899_c0_g2_i1:47-1138(-)
MLLPFSRPALAPRSSLPARRFITDIPTHTKFTNMIGTLQRDPMIQTGHFPSRRNTVINLLPAGYDYVIERFGRFHSVLPAGLNLLFPLIDRIAYVVDTRELCLRIDPQEATTEDNVNIFLGGNLYMRFVDAQKAAYGANKPIYAAAQLAQSVMRSSVGSRKLDVLFKERSALNLEIKSALDGKDSVQKWGCEILRFEVTDLTPSDPHVLQSMNKQSVAERDRREVQTAAEAAKRRVELEADAYRYKQTTEAEGDAAKIRAQADAQAYAIEVQAHAEAKRLGIIAGAVSGAGGEEAVRLLLSQQYITAFGHMAKVSNTLVVPQNVGDVASMIAVGSAAFAHARPAHPAPLLETHSQPQETHNVQ